MNDIFMSNTHNFFTPPYYILLHQDVYLIFLHSPFFYNTIKKCCFCFYKKNYKLSSSKQNRMALNLDPVFATMVGSILFMILVIFALIMSVFKSKYNIDEKHVMRIWDLVEIFGGMLFGFIFGGSVT